MGTLNFADFPEASGNTGFHFVGAAKATDIIDNGVYNGLGSLLTETISIYGRLGYNSYFFNNTSSTATILNIPIQRRGKMIHLIITAGVTNYIGNTGNIKLNGTAPYTLTSGKTYVFDFISNGTNWLEISNNM